MGKVYLSIDGGFLNKNKSEANKKAISEYGEDNKEDLLFDKVSWEENEPTLEFKDGVFHIYGGTDLGYLDVETELDLDTVVDIIEYYMKKLGKLKTVLEATK